MRAVTFQSMLRTSSPSTYSRTSANSIPCPLNTERYSPANSEFTSPRVRSSSSLTWRRISGGTEAGRSAFTGERRPASLRPPGRRARRACASTRAASRADSAIANSLVVTELLRRQKAIQTPVTVFDHQLQIPRCARDDLRALRTLDLPQNPLHDLITGHFLRLRLVCRQDAMAQHIGSDRFDIVRGNEGAAAKDTGGTPPLRDLDGPPAQSPH